MFAPECYPISTPESIVTSKLVMAMVDAGWDVDAVCRGDIREAYPADDTMFSLLQKVCTPVDGHRPMGDRGRSTRPRGRSAALSWSARAIVVGVRSVRRARPDFIFSRIMPQYGHVPAFVLSKVTGIPWVANWSDPMPYAVAPKPFGEGPDARIAFTLKRYCAGIVRQAGWHTFPSARLRDYMCEVFPGLRHKSSVIPHIAHSRLYEALPVSQKAFTICHAGSFGLRNPRTFFEAVGTFSQQNAERPPLTLKLVGPVEDSVKQMVVQLGLEQIVRWLGPLPYTETLGEMATSSVGVIIEANSADPIFLPSKAMDFVQAGIPILAVTPPGSELSQVVNRCGSGLSVDCGSPRLILKGLRTLSDLWQKGELRQGYDLARARSEFSEHHILHLYEELLESLDVSSSS